MQHHKPHPSWFFALCCVLLGLPSPDSAQGQQDSTARDSAASETNVPQPVRDLIVHIVAGNEDGAGIVVGADSTDLYIATAAHVVENADNIRIEFESARGFVPAVVDTTAPFESGIDLAVIRVSLVAATDAGYRPVLDRLGRSGALIQGDEVSPVGCPNGECWRAPLPADRVLTATALEISFQSSFVDGGSSGGAIFNKWWEVVGIVTNDVPPRAVALPIDFTIQQLEAWGVPVTLDKAKIPRAGYSLTVGLSILLPTSGGAFPDGRAPSGRVVLTRSLRNNVDINVGVLRLAPKAVGANCPPLVTSGSVIDVLEFRDRAPCEEVVHAFIAGLGYRIKYGRFVARPFAEIGVGKARGRFDIGGFYEFSTQLYRPNFAALEQTSFGGGGGVNAEGIIFPRIIVQATLGYWRFSDPLLQRGVPSQYEPNMPEVYVGLGIRVGF